MRIAVGECFALSATAEDQFRRPLPPNFAKRLHLSLSKEIFDFLSGSVLRAEAGRGRVLRKQFAREGNSGKGPVPLNRAGSDLEDLRDLLDGEASEVAQLDDARL